MTALAAAPAARAAIPPEGLWRAATHQAVVQIYDCGADLCGRVLSSDLLQIRPDARDVRNHDPALRDRQLKGLVILKGFAGGPVEWRNGTVYNALDGVTYRASIRMLDGDTLRITGCIVAPFCGAQTWTRIKPGAE